ncbi:MAG: 23S rRNA (guanosine(2251)-2'-O)-methyltransferase RlmB [Planctomycetaceae bacterium]|nr:23S rRNA (guanosine(2251)-2'-O)-methyltransferase RlmB [Planctomycetaceae bacterium]
MSSGSRNRKSRRKQLDVSHQKNWLTGRYAVMEALRAGRWLPDELYAVDDLPEELQSQLNQLHRNHPCPLHIVSHERLTQLCHSSHHQGIAARMRPYPYYPEIDLPRLIQSASSPPLLLLCDRIQDTFNLGAILRCCDAMSVTAVVIGHRDQAGVTPQVARSSSGAVNHVPIIRSDNLNTFVESLQKQQFLIAAASEKSPEDCWSQPLNAPLALIIGSEAHGVDDQLLQQCDLRLRIPMLGNVESLNAAVATGILLYEIRRQQRSTSRSSAID